MTTLDQFLTRAEALMARLEERLPAPLAAPDWNASTAFRWRTHAGRDARGVLQPVAHMAPIALSDLHNIGPQKHVIEQNTLQFVGGKMGIDDSKFPQSMQVDYVRYWQR